MPISNLHNGCNESINSNCLTSRHRVNPNSNSGPCSFDVVQALASVSKKSSLSLSFLLCRVFFGVVLTVTLRLGRGRHRGCSSNAVWAFQVPLGFRGGWMFVCSGTLFSVVDSGAWHKFAELVDIVTAGVLHRFCVLDTHVDR